MQEQTNFKKWLMGIFAALIVAFFVYSSVSIEFFDREDREIPIESLSSINDQSSQLDTIPSGAVTERVIFNGEPPYLRELPILDNNLYVKHDNNTFLVGGSDISLIRYSAWSNSGRKATIRDREQHIEFELSEQPYIEFSYKGKFYSIEVISRIYSLRMELRELPKATIELNSKFGDM